MDDKIVTILSKLADSVNAVSTRLDALEKGGGNVTNTPTTAVTTNGEPCPLASIGGCVNGTYPFKARAGSTGKCAVCKGNGTVPAGTPVKLSDLMVAETFWACEADATRLTAWAKAIVQLRLRPEIQKPNWR